MKKVKKPSTKKANTKKLKKKVKVKDLPVRDSEDQEVLGGRKDALNLGQG